MMSLFWVHRIDLVDIVMKNYIVVLKMVSVSV